MGGGVSASGLQDAAYQRALAYEFERRGLLFGRECGMPVVYEGVQVGTRRVDFFVEGGVLV